MAIYKLNPLHDARWEEFLARHPEASMFHSQAWLKALHRTYGYEPVVFTTSMPRAELKNGLVFCKVKSWLTGRRLVSLPFSDHCQPLADTGEVQVILEHVKHEESVEGYKYVEIRPLNDDGLRESSIQFKNNASYAFHKIELSSEPALIFQRFHESCVQRKIRKAEREQLSYEAGRSEPLLQKFHYLFLLTRRRHKLPPPPFSWFRNLIECLGRQLTIHVASKGNDPVSSIITVSYRNSLVYKFGCCNSKFNNLGGTAFLLWRAIVAGKQETGAEEFDLGRSNFEDPGLMDFKRHLGGLPSTLNYYRHSLSSTRKYSGRRGYPIFGKYLLRCRTQFSAAQAGYFTGIWVEPMYRYTV